MAHGYPDYTFIVVPVNVQSGGTGLDSVPVNAVLYGNGYSPLVPITPTVPGTAVVASSPSCVPVWDYPIAELTSHATGILPVANGGWGSNTGTFYAPVDINLWAYGSPGYIILHPTAAGAIKLKGQTLVNADSSSFDFYVSGSLDFSTPQDGARVYNSADISIPSGVDTTLTFDSERYNYGAMHSTSLYPSRLTANRSGVYLITATVAVYIITAPGLILQLRLNGSTPIAEKYPGMGAAGVGTGTITTLYRLGAGDYVEVVVSQSTGSAQTALHVANWSPEFAAQWLSP